MDSAPVASVAVATVAASLATVERAPAAPVYSAPVALLTAVVLYTLQQRQSTLQQYLLYTLQLHLVQELLSQQLERLKVLQVTSMFMILEVCPYCLDGLLLYVIARLRVAIYSLSKWEPQLQISYPSQRSDCVLYRKYLVQLSLPTSPSSLVLYWIPLSQTNKSQVLPHESIQLLAS